MKTLKVIFVAKFEAEIEVPDDADSQDIEDATSNIEIPENEKSKYVEGSFYVINIIPQ